MSVVQSHLVEGRVGVGFEAVRAAFDDNFALRRELGGALRGFPLRLAFDAMNRRSKISRALRGSELPHDDAHVYARNLEVPSGGAVGTARAIAHAYSVFATGGRELGLRPETLDLLAAPAVPPTRGFYDECMKVHGVQFSLGFMKSTPALPFGSASSFGSPGAGGALGLRIRPRASATPT